MISSFVCSLRACFPEGDLVRMPPPGRILAFGRGWRELGPDLLHQMTTLAATRTEELVCLWWGGGVGGENAAFFSLLGL